MKTIGLIGGMSWESSLEYYRILNEKTKEELGQQHSSKCVMTSVDFQEIAVLQHEDKWDELTKTMIDLAKDLEAAKAEIIVICTNTMHKMADDVEANVSIPVIHIVDSVAKQIEKLGLKKVGLLGTKFTMEQDFYKGRLIDKFGLDVVVPNADDREIIHNIIYHELILGTFKKESKQKYVKIINKMIEEGAEGVILGCTEIPLLVLPEDVTIPIFDTTKIHAESAVLEAIK